MTHQASNRTQTAKRAPIRAARPFAWVILIAMTIGFAGASSWLAHPDNAKVIQVLFPFPITIIGSWFLILLALNTIWLLFRRRFDVYASLLFALAAVPISWSGILEEFTGVAAISPTLSTTAFQALPIPLLILSQLFLRRFRSVDRIVFAGLGGVVIAIHLLLHLALTIPEANLSRERQADLLELLAVLPPEATHEQALSRGAVPLPHDIIARPDTADIPAAWGEGASVVFANLRRILADAPSGTHVMIEPGNTVFERIGYLYDGRYLDDFEAPRIYLFPSTVTNQSLMNAQRAHITLAGIGSAFWFLIAIWLCSFHAKLAVRRRKALP